MSTEDGTDNANALVSILIIARPSSAVSQEGAHRAVIKPRKTDNNHNHFIITYKNINYSA